LRLSATPHCSILMPGRPALTRSQHRTIGWARQNTDNSHHLCPRTADGRHAKPQFRRFRTRTSRALSQTLSGPASNVSRSFGVAIAISGVLACHFGADMRQYANTLLLVLSPVTWVCVVTILAATVHRQQEQLGNVPDSAFRVAVLRVRGSAGVGAHSGGYGNGFHRSARRRNAVSRAARRHDQRVASEHDLHQAATAHQHDDSHRKKLTAFRFSGALQQMKRALSARATRIEPARRICRAREHALQARDTGPVCSGDWLAGLDSTE
jgi:hypothetical protein